jgi:hypothetical protein
VQQRRGRVGRDRRDHRVLAGGGEHPAAGHVRAA